jgi:phosphoglycolate phosphatase-like HAD superfamily hydrolase
LGRAAVQQVDLSAYPLIIFDKDGTLLDFDAMWGEWIEALAAGLEAETGQALRGEFFALMGYDAGARRTLAGGHLAVDSLAEQAALARAFLQSRGLAAKEAERAVAAAWTIPDPVATARPCADLPGLFGRLRVKGHRLAVATSDDRAGTVATLRALGVIDLLEAVLCADDPPRGQTAGVRPGKPRPDMVWEANEITGIPAAKTAVVGDAAVDMRMARAAGALAVGVLSGVSDRAALEGEADVIIGSIVDLDTM